MKGEMKLSVVVFAVLVFSGIIIAMTNFGTGLSTYYSPTSENISNLSSIDDIMLKGQEAREKIGEDPFRGVSGSGGIVDFFYTGLTSIWNAMNVIAGAATNAQNITIQSGETLYLPDWSIGLVLTAITLVVVFAIIALITKREV